MGNQASNDAQSSKHETSSKGEGETWEDVVAQVKVWGSIGSNATENPILPEEHRTGRQSSKAESKGESEAWDDVVPSLTLKAEKSSPVTDLSVINEEEATSSNKSSASLKDKDKSKYLVEASETPGVSSMPSHGRTENFYQKHSTHKDDSTTVASEGPGSSNRTTLKNHPPPELSKGVHTALKHDTTSGQRSQMTGLAENNVSDKENEDYHQNKLKSPLHSFLYMEESLGDESSKGIKESHLKKPKCVEKSRSLKETIRSLTRRGRQRSKSFSSFSCGRFREADVRD